MNTLYVQKYEQLPENSNGVILVVEQPKECGATFTYRLDGPKATFLGVGDMHESEYDDMVYTEVWDRLVSPDVSGTSQFYTGLPVSDEFCPKTMYVVLSMIIPALLNFTSSCFLFVHILPRQEYLRFIRHGK